MTCTNLDQVLGTKYFIQLPLFAGGFFPFTCTTLCLGSLLRSGFFTYLLRSGFVAALFGRSFLGSLF